MRSAGRIPGHYYDSVPDHLQFLRDAGFSQVDCFWKRLGLALVGGYARTADGAQA